MADYANLGAGDPAPRFRQASTSNPQFNFDTAAGRWLVLGFLGTAGDAAGARAADDIARNGRQFDDAHAACFLVTSDPADQQQPRLAERLPGLRVFWDFDGLIARAYGAMPARTTKGAPHPYRRFWAIIDPTLRVKAILPFSEDGSAAHVLGYVGALPPPARFAGFEIPAPILVLPDVFEPTFCRTLIDLYDKTGGVESGFMREVDGKTVGVTDPNHKRRKDITIEDEALITATQLRIRRRVVPEIQKVHNFLVTRMERYIVSCYAAEDGGHFRAHRDNTTAGTAHRRFAVSVNLNADFEGGEVSFPEYGPRSYKAPPGGAVVFSCSLLHQVSRVTAGRRYAFLPFLYDDAAARIREANNSKLGAGVGAYVAEGKP
jgi:peroxiredoxin/predicted 2-oxoglutarate/Fe(II)-dependent dioxygenase YbiX